MEISLNHKENLKSHKNLLNSIEKWIHTIWLVCTINKHKGKKGNWVNDVQWHKELLPDNQPLLCHQGKIDHKPTTRTPAPLPPTYNETHTHTHIDKHTHTSTKLIYPHIDKHTPSTNIPTHRQIYPKLTSIPTHWQIYPHINNIPPVTINLFCSNEERKLTAGSGEKKKTA